MTLEYRCGDSATYDSKLLGLGSGKSRAGGSIASFPLCDNHTRVFVQIDRELVEEGWAPAYMGKNPERLY